MALESEWCQFDRPCWVNRHRRVNKCRTRATTLKRTNTVPFEPTSRPNTSSDLYKSHNTTVSESVFTNKKRATYRLQKVRNNRVFWLFPPRWWISPAWTPPVRPTISDRCARNVVEVWSGLLSVCDNRWERRHCTERVTTKWLISRLFSALIISAAAQVSTWWSRVLCPTE